MPTTLEVDHQPARCAKATILRDKRAGQDHAGIEAPSEAAAYANINAAADSFGKNTLEIRDAWTVLIDYGSAEKNLAERPESVARIACPDPKLKQVLVHAAANQTSGG